MILIDRGSEPPKLIAERSTRLASLRAIVQSRSPNSDDIRGYDICKKALWKAQNHKCCYCESPAQLDYNDVEHYRPKARANRLPGCQEIHGYWWLAFTWENLLFSCPGCNRGSGKVDQFPLEMGSTPLTAEEGPPGQENALLIDPARESGVPHIQFRCEQRGSASMWVPYPRNGSRKGEWTIKVCNLDRDELLELYTRHVELHVEPAVETLRAAIRGENPRAIHDAYWMARLNLLSPRQTYIGLSYDALLYFVPASELARWEHEWPMPS